MRPSNALLELKRLNTQLQYAEPSSSHYLKQIVALQLVTILWMCVEAAIASFTALCAHSVALLGFGADSGIELVSAFVVFLRFRKVTYVNEKKAARFARFTAFSQDAKDRVRRISQKLATSRL